MVSRASAIRIGCLAVCLWAIGGCDSALQDDGCYHVHPGSSIQEALERAAVDPVRKCVKVHAGTYRPTSHRQALIWFNARHDGIALQAVGDVTLTAANPEIADRTLASFPAVVNHVVYFGDGISRRTSLRGFKITGANGFVTRSRRPVPLDRSTRYLRNLFFFADGGGIKIFGQSYPTLEDLEIHDNYASPCAGGISVQHPRSGLDPSTTPFGEQASVLIRDCVFRNNRALVTGSAVDLLWDSSAIIENCLFVGNVSNTGEDFTVPDGKQAMYDSEHGCGALTVFRGSRVRVSRCTFTGNFNGVDDMSAGNSYAQSIFWRNDATGGIAPGRRYEVALADGTSLESCFLNGDIADLRGNVVRTTNTFDAPDPDFDPEFRPRSADYENVGYRPVSR
jgi:hypothetical protein